MGQTAATALRDTHTAHPSQNHELITAHLGMALSMARKMARRLPNFVSREDIESAALLGLTEAASRYDRARKEPFMGFAAKRVRGAILDHLRRADMLTRRGRKDARRVTAAKRDLQTSLGRTPDDSEVAAAMGVSDDDFQSHYASLDRVSMVHLEELCGEPTSSGMDTVTEQTFHQHRRAELVRALRSLEERELMILSCYYQEGLTMREVGAVLGVTESRVCQLHSGALAKLRERFG